MKNTKLKSKKDPSKKIIAKRNKKGFYKINDAKIKTFIGDGVCLVVWNDYLYIIDDSKNQQSVDVYCNCDCERCSGEPIKSM